MQRFQLRARGEQRRAQRGPVGVLDGEEGRRDVREPRAPEDHRHVRVIALGRAVSRRFIGRHVVGFSNEKHVASPAREVVPDDALGNHVRSEMAFLEVRLRVCRGELRQA